MSAVESAPIPIGPCIPWNGYFTRDGYGRLRVGSHPFVLAHRRAYELEVGPIPTGLDIDHLCRNRACVNTAHMEPVTRRVNTLRGVGPAAINARKTECVNGHPFTPDNTYIVPSSGRRQCRACNRAAVAAYKARFEALGGAA